MDREYPIDESPMRASSDARRLVRKAIDVLEWHGDHDRIAFVLRLLHTADGELTACSSSRPPLVRDQAEPAGAGCAPVDCGEAG